ncbi:MAG TPA: sigma-70 family RNA polymerase sigma factor [Clostridiaceae bacterium]|nr:sigma-70 family RNA polymerase sigma factor [Clostridiaceae bacterium]
MLKHVIFILGRYPDAEDIVQETFIKLYDVYPQVSFVRTWLIKVSTRLAYNYLRNKKIEKSKYEDMVESKSSNMISIEDAAVINTEMRMIRKILDGMKPRDRICLLLKYSGYTYNEIADMLEIKRTSISQILSRAQKKFMKKYNKEVQNNEMPVRKYTDRIY